MSQPWYVSAYDERYYQTYKDEFSSDQTNAEVAGIIALLNLPEGARVLDVCCGFGRHSIALARRGFRVTGLDLSPDLLRHAAEAADAAGVSIEWIQADMRDIPASVQAQDAVVNLFSSFGFFDDDDSEEAAARAMARALSPGGKIVIETVNREILLRRWMPLRWREQPDGIVVCDRLRFDASSGILHSDELAIHPDGTRIAATHQLRLWSYPELKLLLRHAGLHHFQSFGGLDGSRYTWDTHRMVIVGQKK